jgi:cell division protein FtsA
MQGMVELGEEIFHMPVRVGHPGYHGALAETVRHPRHSTGVGLLLAGMQHLRNRELARMSGGSFNHVVGRMKAWFTGNF